MNERSKDALPVFIYPELADEKMINFFAIYNGEYMPEDVQALDELSNTLKELESRIFAIHEENRSSFGPLMQARNRRANELGKPVRSFGRGNDRQRRVHYDLLPVF